MHDLQRPDEMIRPKFDWTINLGHVMTIAAILVTMATAYTTYQVTMTDHETRIRTLEKDSANQGIRIDGVTSILYDIRQDLAVIKYKLGTDKQTK